MKDNLRPIKRDFTTHTGLKVTPEMTYGDLLLVLDSHALNENDLTNITRWINSNFNNGVNYAHKLIKFGVFNTQRNNFCLGVRIPSSSVEVLLNNINQ